MNRFALSDLDRQELLRKKLSGKTSSVDLPEIPITASKTQSTNDYFINLPQSTELSLSGSLSGLPASVSGPSIDSFGSAAAKAAMTTAPALAATKEVVTKNKDTGSTSLLPTVLPAAITAGANLLTNYFTNKAQEKIQERQRLVEIALQEGEAKRKAFETELAGIKAGLDQQLSAYKQMFA